MSARRLVASVAGGGVLGAAGMLAACSGDNSEPPAVSSFHYVETATGNLDSDPIEEREEGWYNAPDSAHIITNVNYSALGPENIVIGSQVWERRGSVWSASTTESACYNALVSIKGILRYGGQHSGADEIRERLPIAGEPTRVYRWTYEDAGRFIISYDELRYGDSPEWSEILAREKEIFGNLTGTTEITVGKNTGRIYSLVITRDGAKLSDRRETVIDQYNEPMEIEPPPNVPTLAPDSASDGCSEFGDDLPWVPFAIAAVLLPLLFLGASAFLWPRRL
jgi:hypothetical protein